MCGSEPMSANFFLAHKNLFHSVQAYVVWCLFGQISVTFISFISDRYLAVPWKQFLRVLTKLKCRKLLYDMRNSPVFYKTIFPEHRS